MKHHSWLFALFLGCLALAEASCGSSRRTGPEDDDDDGPGGSGSASLSSSECDHCSDRLSGQPDRPFCPGSEILWDNFNACVCELCSDTCGNDCSLASVSSECLQCINDVGNGPCWDPFIGCLDDDT